MATTEEVMQAINDGINVIQKADNLITRCAYRLPGRLRYLGLDGGLLAQLKLELRDFDAHQKRWKR